jgi:hypothetical protein
MASSVTMSPWENDIAAFGESDDFGGKVAQRLTFLDCGVLLQSRRDLRDFDFDGKELEAKSPFSESSVDDCSASQCLGALGVWRSKLSSTFQRSQELPFDPFLPAVSSAEFTLRDDGSETTRAETRSHGDITLVDNDADSISVSSQIGPMPSRYDNSFKSAAVRPGAPSAFFVALVGGDVGVEVTELALCAWRIRIERTLAIAAKREEECTSRSIFDFWTNTEQQATSARAAWAPCRFVSPGAAPMTLPCCCSECSSQRWRVLLRIHP